MGDDLLYFNGINGTTGDYLTPPMPVGRFIDAIVESMNDRSRRELDEFHENDLELRRESKEKHLGVMAGVDATKLAEAGWGVIFAEDDEQRPAIMEALAPLLKHRQEQVGSLYAEFPGSEGRRGYQKGDDYLSFLGQRHVSTGPAEPDKVPYYLLIVGSPEQIPYEFQYMLDVQYAVGRLHFAADSPGATNALLTKYENYARAVVASETGGPGGGPLGLPRRAGFFAPRNPGDRATATSVDYMVKPLAAQLTERGEDWQIDVWSEGQATKDRLKQLLGGGETPALLFTASHGMAYDPDDQQQRRWQGALLSTELTKSGEYWEKVNPERHFFSADDVGMDDNFRGLIAFHFACFGAGTPSRNDFWFKTNPKLAEVLASGDFVARLPQEVLGHSRAALAIIGHVDRAWGSTFLWPGMNDQPQLAAYKAAMIELMAGKPVGLAMEYFNERYGELAARIAEQVNRIRGAVPYDPRSFVGDWTAYSDARNFIILGDPAVRLPLAQAGAVGSAFEVRQAISLSVPAVGDSQPLAAALSPMQESTSSTTNPRHETLRAAIDHLEQAVTLLRSLATDEGS